MAIRKKPKGLGRGLDALLGSDSNALDNLSATDSGATTSLRVDQLKAGKYQPRTKMDDVTIGALAESIAQQGVMQPLLVRRLVLEDSESFEVIAGERRLRAAIKAGLDEVPVIVKDVDDEQAAIMALIENIQREDLNPMEEARGVKRLLDEFALTHEQIASAIGRSRSATSNLLRLLNLAQPVQEMVLQGSIDMGHARALLSLEPADQIQAANLILAKRLSVRETENLVSRGLHRSATMVSKKEKVNSDLVRMQDRLADEFGTKVQIKANQKGAGQLTLSFHNWEQFQGLLEKMNLRSMLDDA
ncbi:MAG: ParB/RepB/Spo0J family partition protein [Burkholderiaceae bacterium]|nr:ParB/RepB/Spo0J family partition protein [Burkholderiaceae bacterium]